MSQKTTTIAHFQALRRPIPIPQDACRIYAGLARKVDPFGELTFFLRRDRRGTNITLTLSGGHGVDASALQWSLSRQHDHWPATYADARVWVREYLARYGQTATEHKSSRSERARRLGS